MIIFTDTGIISVWGADLGEWSVPARMTLESSARVSTTIEHKGQCPCTMQLHSEMIMEGDMRSDSRFAAQHAYSYLSWKGHVVPARVYTHSYLSNMAGGRCKRQPIDGCHDTKRAHTCR